MKSLKLILVLIMSLGLAMAYGQNRTVKGRITSSKDGAALASVEVRLKGAIISVKSQSDGGYAIEIPSNSTDILIFSHPDHDDIEINLNGKTEIDVTLISNVRYNQYGVRVNRNPLDIEERNGILVHESKSGDYKFWFDARVQIDGQMFFGEPLNPIGNGVSVRRARFAAKTEFHDKWYAEIDMDIANSMLELKDAYLAYRPNKNLEFKVGNYKEGYSMESTTTSRYLTFLERPNAVNVFAPSRHLGLSGKYNKNWFLAIAGLHFQAVDDIEESQFTLDNNKDYGTDEGFSFTGKLVAMPFYNDVNNGLHFGVSGSYRTPTSDAEVPGTIRYATRSLSSINRKKYMDTDLIGNVDYSTLTGFEVAGYHKNLRFQSEYLMSGVQRTDSMPNLNFDGFYVFGSWLVFGGKYNYNTVEGEFTQVARGRSWGDVELALRYDYLNLNSGFEELMGGAGEGITFGINYYANNNVKIMLNYSYMNHDRYASGKNKLYVGHDIDGNLTTNPKLVADPASDAGDDFHMIGIRFEVDF